MSVHYCIDCVQTTDLCPDHAKLVDGLQQFITALAFAPYTALAVLPMVIGYFFIKYNRTLVMCKARMNN